MLLSWERVLQGLGLRKWKRVVVMNFEGEVLFAIGTFLARPGTSCHRMGGTRVL